MNLSAYTFLYILILIVGAIKLFSGIANKNRTSVAVGAAILIGLAVLSLEYSVNFIK